MNWEAIGALAELFGAAAVVLSLVYLARQLKMTRQVEQVSAFQGVFNGFTHHAGQFFAAPNGLAHRGLSDRDELSPEDRLAFDQLLGNMLNQLEMTSWLVQAGLMAEADLSPVDWFLEHRLFRHRGAREWLDEFEPTYPPPFVARMRRAVAAASEKEPQAVGSGDVTPDQESLLAR